MTSIIAALIESAKERGRDQVCIVIVHSEYPARKLLGIQNQCDEIIKYNKFNNLCVDDVNEKLDEYFPNATFETNVRNMLSDGTCYQIFIIQFDL